jgi:transposase InsO family protein
VQGLPVLSEADYEVCQPSSSYRSLPVVRNLGIDIVGVLPRAPGGFRFLLTPNDTFTKWMEAMLVVNITQDAAAKFLQSIIYRFGVPKWVLTDNGTQFKGVKFVRCCTDFGINHQASSDVHS